MKPFTDQFALTVIATIDTTKRTQLDETLKAIHSKIDHSDSILPFVQIQGLHFARFVILDPPTDTTKNAIPVQLAYSSNFDGSLTDHLHQITLSPTLEGFHRIFSYCIGFNHDAPPKEAVQAFIHQFQRKVHTFYRGHRGLSLVQIRDESLVRNKIQTYLDELSPANVPVRELKQHIEQHIAQRMPDWKPPVEVELPVLSFGRTLALFIILPLLLVLGLSFFLSLWLGLLALLIVAASTFYLRFLEKTSHSLSEVKDQKTNDKIIDLMANEDKIVQNQLTHLVPLQPGVFRRTLQIIALWALNKLAIYTYNKGRLGDIATIHFARWALIDDGRRLLFFSNFDGSWENYLGDFVDRAAVGLTLAWSNTYEFPKTKWLVLEGATDEERFKTWTRKYQVQTQVWYSGYRELTVKNILRNRAIALGINQPMTDGQINDWLKLL